ncbi:MAG: type I pullulanase [Limnohabitans sp.]|nr:type I pullulanase [Limnohabitans sp.]
MTLRVLHSLGRLMLVAIAFVAMGVMCRASCAQNSDDFPALAGRLAVRDYAVSGQPAQAVLVVHYRREGSDYEGWNIWSWSEGADGAQANFGGKDAFGRYAIIPIADASKRVGFIIRKGNWEAKDFDQDRFISVERGKISEIWIRSGEEAIYTDPTRIDTTLRVERAFLDSPTSITLVTTAPLDEQSRRALVIKHAQDERRAPKVKSVRAAQQSGGKAITEITLVRAVSPEDVAQLVLGWTGGQLANTPAQRVIARDVLDAPLFTPLETTFGAFIANGTTTFTTWSPVSDTVDVLLYEGNAESPTQVIPLARGQKGVWKATVAADLHGTPYRYRFTGYGEVREAPDMHGFAANSDSSRTVIVDLARVEPDEFQTQAEPRIARATDEVMYEVHVRDYSMRDLRAPEKVRGTYLGLTHRAAAENGQVSSGIDHLQELGITAVHLLPVHDFTAKVDEYNWGYWTTLFNVPESNYATNPADPFSAIRDLRTAVTRLHAANIRVILDVVYNHTSDAGPNSPFGAAVPAYFFRTTRDGRLTNDSGTGNGFADERPMARKFIVDSLEHWLRNYRVDGFRFDLLGCHSKDTVRAICERVKNIRPDATLYGEPWTGGGPTNFGKGAQKGLPIAVFNDHLRNAIRGDLDGTTIGFATGEGGDVAAIKRGVAGAIDDFTQEPTETINYASAHDNLILWDKIVKTQPSASDATRRAMQKLALGIVLTSQGIPFIHGGCDFARTKLGNHNSYNAGDDINDFGWRRKSDYRDIFEYTAGLIQLRREHPAFRMADDAAVRRALRFVETDRAVAFTLDGRVTNDPWARIFIAYNDEPMPLKVTLPTGSWTVVVDAESAGTKPLHQRQGAVTLAPYSVFVAHQGDR